MELQPLSFLIPERVQAEQAVRFSWHLARQGKSSEEVQPDAQCAHQSVDTGVNNCSNCRVINLSFQKCSSRPGREAAVGTVVTPAVRVTLHFRTVATHTSQVPAHPARPPVHRLGLCSELDGDK